MVGHIGFGYLRLFCQLETSAEVMEVDKQLKFKITPAHVGGVHFEQRRRDDTWLFVPSITRTGTYGPSCASLREYDWESKSFLLLLKSKNVLNKSCSASNKIHILFVCFFGKPKIFRPMVKKQFWVGLLRPMEFTNLHARPMCFSQCIAYIVTNRAMILNLNRLYHTTRERRWDNNWARLLDLVN